MRAVFLDKDGTLIENVPYNVRPELVRLLPMTGAGLRALHAAGYALIVVSNQSGVARGYFPEAALAGVEEHLRDLLRCEGVALAGFHFCPHHVEAALPEYAVDCDCRKPRPGMIQRAAAELAIDLASSWMIGDVLDDVEAGHRAGCRTVLLGHEQPNDGPAWRQPDHVAPDLEAAAECILFRNGHEITSRI